MDIDKTSPSVFRTGLAPVIDVRSLSKSFKVGKEYVQVLFDINLSIKSGEFIIILGPSGCGKSTLLNIILGLEKPDSGQVIVRGNDIYRLDEDNRAAWRERNFGVIYQQSNWIKSLNVVENVAFPLDVIGRKHKINLVRAKEDLKIFDLSEYAKYVPTELSGGQQTKVSICRALITDAPIILADEPTGNLDSGSANGVMQQLKMLNEDYRRTIVMVTHNSKYKKFASRVVNMVDGRIESIDEREPISHIFHKSTTDGGNV
jgi:putative ABC transport system ATP-binding protein